MTTINRRTLAVAACALAGLVGCGGLGLWGANVVVTENEQLSKERKIEDDRIEDKHPVYDPDLFVTETFDTYCRFSLNKSGSVTKLDIVPFSDSERALDGALFPNRSAALAAVDAAGGARVIPSMEVVNGALKPANDGIYAALELAAQAGDGAGYIGKHEFLTRLLAAARAALSGAPSAQVPYLQDAAAYIDAARQVSGESASLTGSAASLAQTYVTTFLADSANSRPIGFYSWSPALETIFRQDRFLQSPAAPDQQAFGRWVALAALIKADPDLQRAYETTTALYAGLTNPYWSYTLSALFDRVGGLDSLSNIDAIRNDFLATHSPLSACVVAPLISVLPASRGKDTEYFCSLPAFPNSLLDALIDAIRGGTVDLTPSGDSGWYDYQLASLETLLVPERGAESQHLLLTAAYKKKLLETFKSIVTQTRETHAKQLSNSVAMSAEMDIDLYPQFPVEPFPTFYLRTARGYRFLATYLSAVLGADLLAQTDRLAETGATGGRSVASELDRAASLLYGLYALTCDSLGMRPEAQLLQGERDAGTLTSDRSAASDWLSSWRTDVDVLRDPRVIDPVGHDDVDARYWATIGVKVYKSSAEFVKGFEPSVTPLDYCQLKGFVPTNYYLLVEETVEVAMRRDTPPLTRSEFRQLCDAKGTREGIVAALEAR